MGNWSGTPSQWWTPKMAPFTPWDMMTTKTESVVARRGSLENLSTASSISCARTWISQQHSSQDHRSHDTSCVSEAHRTAPLRSLCCSTLYPSEISSLLISCSSFSAPSRSFSLSKCTLVISRAMRVLLAGAMMVYIWPHHSIEERKQVHDIWLTQHPLSYLIVWCLDSSRKIIWAYADQNNPPDNRLWLAKTHAWGQC